MGDKYQEISQQMEGLLQHFSSNPAPSISEVLDPQGTSAAPGPLSYSGYNPAPGDYALTHDRAEDDSIAEERSTIDMGFIETDFPSSASDRGGKAARPQSGARNASRWGLSVPKGRRPKGKGALFPRESNEQYPESLILTQGWISPGAADGEQSSSDAVRGKQRISADRAKTKAAGCEHRRRFHDYRLTGSKAARSLSGASNASQWGLSVPKGRRPKGKGALFPRESNEQYPE
eukprot:gene18720-25246_t